MPRKYDFSLAVPITEAQEELDDAAIMCDLFLCATLVRKLMRGREKSWREEYGRRRSHRWWEIGGVG